MRKLQHLLFVFKRSYICYYIICMTVLLKKEAEKFGQQSKKLDSGSRRLEHLQDPNDVCQCVIALYSLIFWF